MQVVGGVGVQVHAAGGNLVQVRLPEMRARLFDQRDAGFAGLTQLVAQTGGQLQAAGTAADDEDAVQIRGGRAFSPQRRQRRQAASGAQTG